MPHSDDKTLNRFYIDQEFPGWSASHDRFRARFPSRYSLIAIAGLIIVPLVLLAFSTAETKGTIIQASILPWLIAAFWSFFYVSRRHKALLDAFDYLGPVLGYEVKNPRTKSLDDRPYQQMLSSADIIKRRLWISGHLGDAKLDIFEAITFQTVDRSNSQTFAGTLLHMTLPRSHGQNCLVRKDAGIFNKLSELFQTYPRVEIDDASFEHYFEVYAKDATGSRAYFNATRRQALSDWARYGYRTHVLLRGCHIYVAIENFKLIKLPHFETPSYDMPSKVKANLTAIEELLTLLRADV